MFLTSKNEILNIVLFLSSQIELKKLRCAIFPANQSAQPQSKNKNKNKRDKHRPKRINSFQAMLPYMGAKKGSFFYGGVSPSKIGLIAPY
jgi:hypothetical protein